VPVAVKVTACNVLHNLLNLINNLVKLRLLNKRQLPVLQPSKNPVRVSAAWLPRV
jgi:hypothetical protein